MDILTMSFRKVVLQVLDHSEKVMRFFRTFLVQELKLSITGDTAKILGLTLERLCTFTLRPILPREKNETRSFRRRIQPYTPDPFPLAVATSECLTTS